MSRHTGRHFLQVPGPTNVPDQVLQALAQPTIDHRGPEFAELTHEIIGGLRALLHNPDGEIMIFPSSGNGGWEAALVNTLSPGDRVLAFDNGFFARGWATVAERLGLVVELLPGDWRYPVDPSVAEQALAADKADSPYRAVLLVHNETTTGVRSDVAAMRYAIDRAGHPALLMVDAVSSLAAMPLPQADWGVDVVVAGSQKGLMLPPGLGFNSASRKALATGAKATLPRAYWDWATINEATAKGYFPYTPSTNLLFGLREALRMLAAEGEVRVHARHERFAAATRAAVEAWGLEVYCADSSAHSPALTTVAMPDGIDADAVRRMILEHYDMSLGTGLGPLRGKVFRIGHLGAFNELMLAGTLAGVEMGLQLAGVAHHPGGVTAALTWLTATADIGRTR